MAFCIRCGSLLKDNHRFCGVCGSPVSIPVAPVCSKCNTPGKIGDKFCGTCGASLIQIPNRICGNCNAPLSNGDKFCIKCGAPAGTSSSLIEQHNNAGERNEMPDQTAIERKKADEKYQTLRDAVIADYKKLSNDEQLMTPEQQCDLWYAVTNQLQDVYNLSLEYPEREGDSSVLKIYMECSESKAEKYLHITKLRQFEKDFKTLQSDYKTEFDDVQENDTEDEMELLLKFENLYGRVTVLVDQYYEFKEDDDDGTELAELQSNIAYCYCSILYAMNRYVDGNGEKLNKQQIYDYNAKCAEISRVFKQIRFSALFGLSSYKLYLACVNNEKNEEGDPAPLILSSDKNSSFEDAKKALAVLMDYDYCYKVSAYSESGHYFDTAEWENAANGLIRLFNILIKEEEYEAARDLSWMAIQSHAAAASRKENGNAKRFMDSFIERNDRFVKDEDGDLIYKK